MPKESKEIEMLRYLAEGSGGFNVRETAVAGRVGIAFDMEQGSRVERFRYFVRDDRIYLRQITGRERGKEGEVATMSALLEADAENAAEAVDAVR